MQDKKLSTASKVSLPAVDNSEVLKLAEVLMNTCLTSHQATFLVSAVRSCVDSSLDGSPVASVVAPTAVATSMSAPPVPTTTTPATPATATVASQVIPLAGGDPYNIPSPNQAGPFYLVTKGKEPGIYAGWNNAGVQVLGVPGSVYRGVPLLAMGIALMNSAVAADQAARIVV